MSPEEFIALSPLFSKFTADDAKALLSNSTESSFTKGQTLFQADKVGENMYILTSGLVKICRNVQGKDVTLAVLGQGDLCGEMSLADDGPRSATAIAVEDTAALCLERKKFAALKDGNVGLYLRLLDCLIKTLCLRLRQANQTLEVIRYWIT